MIEIGFGYPERRWNYISGPPGHRLAQSKIPKLSPIRIRRAGLVVFDFSIAVSANPNLSDFQIPPQQVKVQGLRRFRMTHCAVADCQGGGSTAVWGFHSLDGNDMPRTCLLQTASVTFNWNFSTFESRRV